MNAPNLPAFIANRPSRGLAQRVSQNLGTSSPPYLSIMGNRFTLIDAAGNEQPLATYEGDPNKVMRGQNIGPYADVVIIDVNNHLSRIFYDQPFDPNAQNYQPPACFSHNGIGPSRQASTPQSPTCAACPKAVWGSAVSNVSGKGIPACAQYQLVSILVWQGSDMPFLLRIPPNSLKNYRAYAEQFRSQNFDMNHVVTRLSFISQGTLAFIPVAFIDQAMFDKAEKLLDAKATDGMVGRTDQAVAAVPAPASFSTGAPVSFPPGGPGATAPAQLVSQQPAPQPAPQQPTRRGRGRPPAPQQPAQTGPAQPVAPVQAPFMPSPAPAAAQPAPNGGAPEAPFGMTQAVPPNPELTTMLDNLFGKQ